LPRLRSLVLALGASCAVTAGVLVACGPQAFDPQSKVDSVRMFAVRADKPYAKPGEEVTLDVLMTDARRERPEPMEVYWIPIVCTNPRDDLYYLCFAPDQEDAGTRLVPAGPLADAGVEAGTLPEAGADDLLSRLPVGIDLSPFLPKGPSFSFRMPDDVIRPREGTAPYGLAVVFNIACAGRIVLAERDPAGGPQQIPLQCVDRDRNKLPPSDYVIGISRVYAYADRTNTNPVIESATLAGQPVDIRAGITLPKCVAERRSECQKHEIDIRVSDSSWEENPSEVATGRRLREQIWVAYFSDQGSFENDARLLFDSQKGRVTESAVVYRAPNEPGEGTIWAVVHDNRGGAAWVTIPLHVQ
jgi:hypothetical protein